MINLPTLAKLTGARVLVVGLGRAGSAAARFLLRVGARVAAVDEDPSIARRDGVRRLVARGLLLRPHAAPGQVDVAVVSPGIAESSPLLRRLRSAGTPVVDELDLASTLLGGRLVAVTGTNGKSTTAALVARMLEAAGRTVFVGGNLAPGRPLSAALLGPARDYYVVEVSSFQLERARLLRPDVALLLNITPDHLNRHRDLGRYARCKYRLLARQRGTDRAVLNLDDPLVVAAAGIGRAGREFFTLGTGSADARIERGWLIVHGRRVLPARDVRLRGRHNIQNALAACCAVMPEGVEPDAAARVLRGFAGLPHRLEPVRTVCGVEYINNSMCTNPAAGIRSLGAFKRKVVLITGGREKNLPRDEYLDAIVRSARRVVLTGENAGQMAVGLTLRGFRRCEVYPKLADAVRAASRRARPGETVLYSPAFASFDQFSDFQARGRAFRREVLHLR
jgi:UDP-N-acetylmuramoylalanine--D-glutamate ligase